MKLPLILLVGTLCLVNVSCEFKQNSKELNELKKTNLELQKENIELRKFRDSLEFVPYIENTLFETKVGKPYYLQLLTIVPKDITIDNVYINGKKVDLANLRDMIVYNEYGPMLEFKSDTSGIFQFKVDAKFKVWGNKIVPLSWPIEVLEE